MLVDMRYPIVCFEYKISSEEYLVVRQKQNNLGYIWKTHNFYFFMTSFPNYLSNHLSLRDCFVIKIDRRVYCITIVVAFFTRWYIRLQISVFRYFWKKVRFTTSMWIIKNVLTKDILQIKKKLFLSKTSYFYCTGSSK